MADIIQRKLTLKDIKRGLTFRFKHGWYYWVSKTSGDKVWVQWSVDEVGQTTTKQELLSGLNENIVKGTVEIKQ